MISGRANIIKRLLLLLSIGTLAGLGQNAAAEPRYQLIWADEFNYHGAPDPAKWGYEEGFVRNQEKQFYTRDRRANARVENGCLVIEAKKEHVSTASLLRPDSKPEGNPGASVEYTSASLNTLNKFSFCYGKLEVRAKLPNSKGTWPAIWTMGANIEKVQWPRCGEIDVMEFVGNDPTHIFSTVHFFKDGQAKSIPAGMDFVNQGFHLYTMVWTSSRIDFFFDKQRITSFPLSQADDRGVNPFRLPHYLLLNLALGGNWGGAIDDRALPQQYLIDYVRVYREITPAQP